MAGETVSYPQNALTPPEGYEYKRWWTCFQHDRPAYDYISCECEYCEGHQEIKPCCELAEWRNVLPLELIEKVDFNSLLEKHYLSHVQALLNEQIAFGILSRGGTCTACQAQDGPCWCGDALGCIC